MLPYFLGNAIYPVHFMWETGLMETIGNSVDDVHRNRRFGGLWDEARDHLLDLLDGGIELTTRGVGRPIWAHMKDNATRASADNGGADLFGKAAKRSESAVMYSICSSSL